MKSRTVFVIVGGVLAVAIVAGMAAIRSTQTDTPGSAPAATAKAGGSTKQLWHCGMHPQVIQDHPGFCPICHMALTPIGHVDPAKGGKQLWWDPMLGPSSITDHPGKSAMGMDMVKYTGQSGGGSAVIIDPAVVQNMGVRTAKVVRAPLHRNIRTVGMIKLPEPGMHDVSPRVGGWIEKLYADQDGMHVIEGQPLFDLYSPDLQVAEQELIGAVQASKAQGSPDDENASLIESAKRRLRLWGIAEQDIDAIAKAEKPPATVPIRSPATGHIEDKAVVQGSAVAAMTRVMRVADHSRMWLQAQVYEDQIGLVKEGQTVRATVQGTSDKHWDGTISFIYPHLDPVSRTLMVRMTLANPEFALKPGMYATAEIMLDPIADAVQAPREAVIDTGTRQIAFIDTGGGHFEARRVRMGWVGDDGTVQILSGLSAGETVVTSGQFLLDAESRTMEAIANMGAQSDGGAKR